MTTSGAADFIDVCKLGRIEVLEKMLAMSAELVDARSDDEMPAIVHATCANQVSVVELLLTQGCDIEAKDAYYKGTALGFAAWHGYDEIATLLVERGADVDGMGEEPSPLALALDGVDGKLTEEGSPGTKAGHTAIVSLLQSRNAVVIGRIMKPDPSVQ